MTTKNKLLDSTVTHQRVLLLLVVLTLFLVIGAGEVAAQPYETGLDAFCNSDAPDFVKEGYCSPG